MKIIKHKFVEFVPNLIEEGVLYISVEYRTAVHLCVCGCGNKVVTPISPSGWLLKFNGKAVSLSPSIGNWNFPCKSHYFITENEVKQAFTWGEKMFMNKGEKVKRKRRRN